MKVGEAQGAVIATGNLSSPYELIVAGGYYTRRLDVTNKVYSFPLLLKRKSAWKPRADMPLNLTHAAQVVVGTKMYICGGYLGKHPGPSIADCFCYDYVKDKWDRLPSLPDARAGGGMVYNKFRKALFFAGGAVRQKGGGRVYDYGDSYVLYLAKQDEGWQRRAIMPNPRNHMSAVSVYGRYFFVAGQHGKDELTGNQDSLHEYRFASNTWIKRADIPFPIGHVSASTPRYYGGFFMIGGVINGKKKSKKVLYYHLATNAWYDIGDYQRTAQTPVCGVKWNRLICATAYGKPGGGASGYMRRVTVPRKRPGD